MWKVVLVLFLISESDPGGIMLAELPQTFASEAACQSFVSGHRDEIFSGVEFLVEETGGQTSLLHHETDCVEDTSQSPAI